jgi:cystathionine gamma-synthase
MHPATVAVSTGRPEGVGQPLNHPIVLASNFRGEAGDYSRTHGTPTWHALEAAVGALEGGDALAFSSGMAAAAGALFALAPRVLVLPTNSYLGVRSLVADLVEQGRLEVRFVDIADTSAVVAATQGADQQPADTVWVETPTNPTLDVADVPAICAAAAAAGAKVVVDNTFATPVCAQPLRDGATIVVHSGTKFIGGHSDLLMGLAITADRAVYDRLHHT